MADPSLCLFSADCKTTYAFQRSSRETSSLILFERRNSMFLFILFSSVNALLLTNAQFKHPSRNGHLGQKPVICGETSDFQICIYLFITSYTFAKSNFFLLPSLSANCHVYLGGSLRFNVCISRRASASS